MSKGAVPAAGGTGVRYRERVNVPWWMWLVALFWASTLGIAYGHSLGRWAGSAVGAIALTLAAVGLQHAATVIVVDQDALTVGRANLPLSCLGEVRPLGADAARRLRGPDADPRAFSVLRGWVSTAVRVQVADPRDPTPYWYVSTRHPEALAAALSGAGRTPA